MLLKSFLDRIGLLENKTGLMLNIDLLNTYLSQLYIKMNFIFYVMVKIRLEEVKPV